MNGYLQDSASATFEGLRLFDYYTPITSRLSSQRDKQYRCRINSPLQVA